VPVIFKGSGFYTTDSRGSKEGKPESGKGEPSGKEENEGD
jgi:predicted nucleic acid-binding Zn ribbon protein